MTVEECYKRAVAFIPEEENEDADKRKFMVEWCNILLAECVDYENIFRRVKGIPELDFAPEVHDGKDEIPYNQRLVSMAFPYGMARIFYREDDVSASHEFYQLYVNALSEATPLEFSEITDVYK